MQEQREDAGLTGHETTTTDRGALGVIERAGNRLPDPLTIFVAIALAIVAISGIGAWAGWSVTDPATGETVVVDSMLTRDGFVRMFEDFTTNVGDFFPLIGGLVIMLGIALMEKSGLAQAVLKRLALGVPAKGLTLVIIYLGLMSSIASDVGFILLPPLAGMLFYAANRNPLTGIIVAYAAVAAGFQANVLVGIVEVVGFGFAEEAAQVIDPQMTVGILSNWYFQAASALILPLGAYYVTERILVPRLGAYRPTDLAADLPEFVDPVDAQAVERRAMKRAGLTALAIAAGIVLLVAPPGAPLREAETGAILGGPFMTGSTQVVLVTLLFAVPSIVFGVYTKAIRSDQDVARMITEGLATFGPYILLAIFASQAIAYFGWTNLGAITAVSGADLLSRLGVHPLLLLFVFALFVGALNVIMASAAAKWALLAPVFVPMFMLLDIHPAATFMVYRIGDSATNAITPMLPYFIILLGFVKRYDPSAKLGTLIAALLPYAITFFGIWIVQLAIWYLLGLPLGPGVDFGLGS
jgi:aminobenzoyl-glutamate transport protein